ncbi:MAG: LysR family transcriptional regulator [Sneathiella sp.]|nr:LysR family transcriptional regulator [Sneathiella sp.]
MYDLPPLGALRAFEVVCRTGGIRAAAREIGVTHSSISRHMGELETWLGTALFERSAARRSMELTSAGKQLGLIAGEAFQDIARGVAAIRETRRHNEVVVSTTQSIATRWLLPRLHIFNERFPHIEISVRVDQRPIDFKGDQADLAIRMGRGKWPGLNATPLMGDYLAPVMSPALKDQYPFRSLDDWLSRGPLLHDLDPDANWKIWKDRFGPESLDMNKGPQITSSDLVLRAAALKQGVALGRLALAMDELESAQLVRLSDDYMHIEEAYWVVTPLNRKRPNYVDGFIDWILEEGAALQKVMARKMIEA